ncbi:hypothetical protein GCM10010317_032410 [Streptomyces mirabilis]|nr:hypothetical protein GCM10010317_032410 [Streptomyces mirabilis]
MGYRVYRGSTRACLHRVLRPRRPYPTHPQGLRPFDPEIRARGTPNPAGLRPLDPRSPEGLVLKRRTG